jgi:outer membrane lipoprotein SlyB
MRSLAVFVSTILLGTAACYAQENQSNQQEDKPGIVAQSGAAVGQTAAATAGTAVAGPLGGAVAGVVGGAVGGTVGKVVEGGGKKKQACKTEEGKDQDDCQRDQQAQQQDSNQANEQVR